MKKIILTGLASGTAIFIVSLIEGWLISVIFPSLIAEYQNTSIFRPWSDPLMSLYFAYPFILGFILAWIWEKTKKLFTGDTRDEKVTRFAFTFWAVTTLPGMYITYSSFQLSLPMIFSWSVTSLIEILVAGWVMAKINIK